MVSFPTHNPKGMPEAGDDEQQENLLIFHEFYRAQQRRCPVWSRGGCINVDVEVWHVRYRGALADRA